MVRALQASHLVQMLDLLARYRAVRQRTVQIAEPITVEHSEMQPLPDGRSVAWHIAHTSWFFERFVLARSAVSAAPKVLPSIDQAMALRIHIDEQIARALQDNVLDRAALAMLEHGLHHEQQHQEMLLTDLKVVLARLPGAPAYRADLVHDALPTIAPLAFVDHAEQVVDIGASDAGFAFAQERPRHRVAIAPFRIATRPLANAEVLAFIGDRGYDDPRLWSRAGWLAQRSDGWRAPMYWFMCDRVWFLYTLGGVREVDPAETACHLSYFEAEAIARWAGARLPTELEWEHAARSLRPRDGNWADDDRLQPRAATSPSLAQMFGDVWEWTRSAYLPYPGSQPPSLAAPTSLGPRNELDDCSGNVVPGHMVVRGGSALTARGHVRASYRKSLPLTTSGRCAMTGVRLAQDLGDV